MAEVTNFGHKYGILGHKYGILGHKYGILGHKLPLLINLGRYYYSYTRQKIVTSSEETNCHLVTMLQNLLPRNINTNAHDRPPRNGLRPRPLRGKAATASPSYT